MLFTGLLWNMYKGSYILFIFLCIMGIFIAGCTQSDDNAPVTPAATISPQVVTTTAAAPAETTQCYWDPQKMACSDHPVTAATTIPVVTSAAISVTTTAGPDPILHRWVRQYPAASTGAISQGYEFNFYPEGTVVYKEGTITEVSSNLLIPSPDITGSGSWTKLSEDHYLVKVTPVNSTGTNLPPIVRQYVHVAAYGTIPEHLVSDYEQTYLDNATRNGLVHSYSDEVFYVDRVKTD